MQALLPVANVLGALLMAFAVTYLLPIATSLIYDDGTAIAFVLAMLIDFAVGCVLSPPAGIGATCARATGTCSSRWAGS